MVQILDGGAGSLDTGDSRARDGRIHPFVYVFLVGLVLPPEIVLNLGSVKLPVYRIVLVLAAIPCIVRLIKMRHNPTPVVDTLFFLYVFWAGLSIIVVHGLQIWQSVGLSTIEGLVPYLLAKTYIQTAAQFRKVCKILFVLVLALLPIALVESATGATPVRDIARAIFGWAPMAAIEQRMGLNRAFATFAHPIHFGVFCASLIGFIVCLNENLRQTLVRYLLVSLATFCSLSSGGLLSLVLQYGLVAYDRIFLTVRSRWQIFAGLGLLAYFLVDMVAKSTPMSVFIRYLTMSSHNAYIRVHIWNYGVISVENNPIFGIGFHQWERPEWLTPSMDNFWLVIAVRNGLPAVVFFALAIVTMFFRLTRTPMADDRDRCRKGWCISMTALIIAGSTVHYWDALYCYFIFVLGSAGWILRQDTAEEIAPEDAPEPPVGRHVLASRQEKPRNHILG